MYGQDMKDKPNIIVCICDQMQSFALGCYGNDYVRTPNIDRLGNDGVQFDIGISNNPVCMPGRSSLMSGKHARTCMGYFANDVAMLPVKGALETQDPEYQRGTHLPGRTLADCLREAGYTTAAVGKWHIRPAPELIGFDYSLLPMNNHRHTGQEFRENGGKPVPVDGFSLHYEIENVEKYLATPREKPFFLYYSIMPPHMPLADMPEEYLTMYSPDEVPLRPNVAPDGKLPFDEEELLDYLWDYRHYSEREPDKIKLPDGFDVKDATALYYGAVSWVDEMVGRMMRALEANGLDKNTLVIFTADHGDELGSHGQWMKARLTEESIRVPMIYWAPEMYPACENRSQGAQLVDIMPTLLDVAGTDIPEEVQGRSLASILAGQTESLEDNAAYIQTSSWIGVRTPTHTYGIQIEVEEPITDGAERKFYDNISDPYQLRELAGTGEQAELAKELEEQLIRWHESIPLNTNKDARQQDRTHLFDTEARWKGPTV